MATEPNSVELIVPSNAERAITGWSHSINFSRRGHDYTAQYHASGLAIERDGAKVRSWDDLPANVQKIIRAQKNMLRSDSAA